MFECTHCAKRTLSVHQKLMATEMCPAHCRGCGGNSQPVWSGVDLAIALLASASLPLFCWTGGSFFVLTFVIALPALLVAAWYRPLARSPKRGDCEILWLRTVTLLAFVVLGLVLLAAFFARFLIPNH